MSEFDDDTGQRSDRPRAAGRVLASGRHTPSANPDDPITQRPPQGRDGPLPGPHFLGAPGRVAIVQAQVFIVGLILVAQLWLVTTALLDLLSGRGDRLWLLVVLSGIGFALGLVVAFWPLRRVRGL